MATTSALSTNELSRLASLAYTGKVVQACLAYDNVGSTTVEDTVATWDALELTQGTDGYERQTAIIGTATANTSTVDVTYPSIDFSYTASVGTLTFNRVFIFLGTLNATTNITLSERTSNIATLTAVSHNLIATDWVYVTGTGSAEFDGFHQVLSAPTADTFTFASTGADKASGADTGTAQGITWETNLYGLLTEDPTSILADGQTQTYRVTFSLDD